MVKNPVNTDVDLWEGAIERFEKVGITESLLFIAALQATAMP
jgi:hypothetical protein